ncbi:MAG: glycosyltransferase [Spirochaetaceae bacterium]|nr:glycosyltransferase [Spirochaetaceae bacterium]
MTVSVTIPTYNRASLLSRAVESVISQSHADWNLTVVDDGSTDGTSELLDAYTDSRINTLRIPHQGVSAARNAGVRASRGRGGLLAFLDSDDEWLPEKLERQLGYWNENPDVSLVYSSEIWIRGGRRVNPPKQYRGVSGRILIPSIRACVISPSTAMMKRETFEELGGFDESYPVCEDYDLWLRLCSRHEVGWIPKPLVIRHGGRPDQLSESTPAMDYWRVKAMAQLHESISLSADEHAALEEEIVRRGRVLLKGYRSRANRGSFDEVISLIQTVVPAFRMLPAVANGQVIVQTAPVPTDR